MSENTAHVKIEMGSARNFGLVFAAFFLGISAFLYFSKNTLNYWVILAALAFVSLAVVKPKLLEPLNILWFKLGMILGAIVAPLVMILIYFLVVTPTGLLMRLFGKDPLLLRKSPGLKTHWIKREKNNSQPSSMKNQF
ncbi:hypothetical protein SAMN02745866_03344 [Alteromonadaceae bacterium Bs31]|nr:hypothetical protein SAMN02745866_03344 [Alteromonadaceae bacterium Bs31]